MSHGAALSLYSNAIIRVFAHRFYIVLSHLVQPKSIPDTLHSLYLYPFHSYHNLDPYIACLSTFGFCNQRPKYPKNERLCR